MTRKLSVQAKVSSLALAVALAAGPSPTAAQSLQGTPTVSSGSASISEGATTTTVTVDTSQTVIDWAPDDNAVGNFGAINFQPAGTTATFQNNVDLVGDFAVLNRVNVTDQTRIVALNGTINSLVNGQTGGSIFFYSPSGFVLTGTSIINVGSLVLSASPITVDGNGNFINSGTVTFGQAPNPNAAINTVAGSQINANGTGSYVALVAPRINHQGTIHTDTAAALVAAEAATINFSPDGLFDIQVTIGTDDPNGINIDGGTIARNDPTEVGGPGNHYAYLVAVAKNDAVTMLINNGGSVGFDTATSATVEDNVVVLSGGFNVSSGSPLFPNGNAPVSLTIDNATMSSDVFAQVSGGATITTSTGSTAFGNNLTLFAGDDTIIEAINGNALAIGGSLTANVDVYGNFSNPDVTGNLLRLRTVSGGSSLTVGGDVTLSANAYAFDDTESGIAGDAIGGTVIVQTGSNGSIAITGGLDISADGFGGDIFTSDTTAGNGTGGTAQILVNGGNSSISVGGSTFVSAEGQGGSSGECSICNVTGGNGTGGNVDVNSAVGSNNVLTFSGDLTLSAAGFGGSGDTRGGDGHGGQAHLGAADGNVTNVLGSTSIDASGFGGYGFNALGGTGIGGLARVSTFGTLGSLVDLIGDVFVTAGGTGGEVGSSQPGGQGGTGTGGVAEVAAMLGTVHAHNNLTVAALSNGGGALFSPGGANGGSGIANIDGNDPNATIASLFSAAGTLTVDGLTTLNAGATGADGINGGSGGNAVAGFVSIHAANRDTGTSVIQLGNVIGLADANGGAGGDGLGGTDGGNGGNGGNATAGRVVVTAAAGSGDLTASATIASASATGGAGGSGGNSDGGNGANGGNGGTATGGLINVGTESGNTNFAQGANNGTASYATIVGLATATGGAGGDGSFGTISGIAGNGGDAFGGQSALLVRGSLVTVGSVSLDASATGGDGGLSPSAPNGDGGDATAGSIGVVVTNRFNLPLQRGTLNAGNITGTAIATGGTGGLGNGQSLAIGGNQFVVRNSDATINSVSLVTTADSFNGGSQFASSSPIEVANGAVVINGQFVFQTPGSVSMWNDGGTLNASQIIVDADNFIHDAFQPAPATLGTFAANNIILTTGQDLIVDGHMVSLNGVGFTAPGLIDFDNVTSTNGPLTLTAGSTVNAGNLSAGTLVVANGGGNVTLGTVHATSQQALVNSTNGNIVTGAINAGTFIGLNAPLGAITSGNLTAGSFVQLTGNGNIQTGNINAGTSIDVESFNGLLNLVDLSATTTVNLDAPVSITFRDVVADDFDFDTGGAATGRNIVAGTIASGDAGGAVNLGNINVGLLISGGPAEQGFAVGITSATSISVGNVDADEAIGFATLGNFIAGNLNAGTNVMTLIGGNTTIASITTPGTGRTYHGDAQMFLNAGGPDDFDPSLVFGVPPVRSGGSYTVTGAISTGRIQVGAATISTAAITAPISIYLDSANGTTTGDLSSNGLIQALSGGSILTGNVISGANILFDAGTNIATGTVGSATNAEFDAGGNVSIGTANVGSNLIVDAGGNLNTGAVTAGSIDATAGGLATLNGMWQSPDVDLLSNDIDIAANGGIDAGNSGSIRLGSTNGTQALIGDGLTGTGYTLTNAEFGRLSAGNLQIAARGDASAAIDMLIGNLTITGPLAGSTIDDPSGSVTFATGDPQTQTPGGVIRVTGSVNASGFTDTNSLEFLADRFELDAATGLIQITSTGATLSGELFIDADRVHVASGSILDQLAIDPHYSGYQDDLNAPAAVQRPDGVVRAGSIEVFSNGPLAVLVQNTGTANNPAGFLTLGDGPLLQGQESIGPIEMVINGQLITEGGLLTGVDVLNFLIDSNNIGFFTANSTINGCSLTGVCAGSNPIPPGSTPTPGIQDVITLIGDDVVPPPPFGNEDVIDDNDDETDDDSSPIVPPDPLFDTSELGDASGGEGPDTGTAMRSSTGLKNDGDVDDPVSGSGNPGLMESPPPPPTSQEKQP